MAIRKYRISSGAIAADGSATAYSDVIRGKILSVSVNYPAHSCTVDLDEQDTLKSQKIVDLASSSTDAVVYPRTPSQDITGSDVTFDGTNEIYEPFVVFGRLKLTIASGTAAEEVVVDIVAEE